MKKILISVLIFSLILTNLGFIFAPRKVEALTLKEALENLKVKGAERATENSESSNTEDKKLELAKTLVNKIIEGISKWLEAAETRLSLVPRYSEEQKTAIKAKIDEIQLWLAEVKTKVEGATTVDEVKSTAASAKEQWDAYKVELKLVYIEVWTTNAKSALEKLETVSGKIEEMIAELETNQKVDTTKLKELLNKLNNEIAESQTKIDEATANLEAMKNLTGQELIKKFFDTREMVVAAIANLMTDATELVRDIMQEIKSLLKTQS